MKRRELIKNGLLVGSTAICAGLVVNHIDSQDKIKSDKIVSEQSSTDEIIPKQTAVYKICAPLPFNFELIDEIDRLNKRLTKSKVTTLYNNIPNPLWSKYDENFQGPKGYNDDIKTFDDFKKYVSYARDLGFNFVYVLNSPKPFSEDTFKKYEKDLFDLFDKLAGIGCTEIRLANHQLIKIISEIKPNFRISLSTSCEYHNISQYSNLIKTYPNISSINISIDDNRNFKLLKNLKTLFPKVDIEIMVNEDCIHGCPARISHPSSMFCSWDCDKLRQQMGEIGYFCKTNMIYPWDLKYYSAIGINSFKFMASGTSDLRANVKSIDFLQNYLECIENGIQNIKVSEFFNKVLKSKHPVTNIKHDVALSEIMPYFPDIKHFVKHGDECTNICETKCNYCLECAKKIKETIC